MALSLRVSSDALPSGLSEHVHSPPLSLMRRSAVGGSLGGVPDVLQRPTVYGRCAR